MGCHAIHGLGQGQPRGSSGPPWGPAMALGIGYQAKWREIVLVSMPPPQDEVVRLPASPAGALPMCGVSSFWRQGKYH